MFTMPIESEMEVFARVYSKSMDVKIVPGPGFASDGRTITVVPALDQMDPWTRFKTEVIVYHETAHVKFTDFKGLPRTSILHSLHNSIEDAWIEREMETKWKGMKRKWIEFLSKFINTPEAAVNHPMPPIEWMGQLLYTKAREKHLGIDLGIDAKVPDGIMKIWNARVAKYLPEVVKCKSTKVAVNIAKRVLAEFKDIVDPPKPKPDPKKGDQDGQGQGQGQPGDQKDGQGQGQDQKGDQDKDQKEGQGQGQGQSGDQKDQDQKDGQGQSGDQKDQDGQGQGQPGDQNGDSQAQDGQQNGQEGSQGPKKAQKGKGKADKDPLDDADAKKAIEDLKKQMESGNADPTNDIGSQIKKDLNRYVNTHNILKEEAGLQENIIRYPSTGNVSAAETMGRKITAVNATKFRNLFISERAPRWQENLDTGKINSRKLYRLKTGSVSVFHRKTEKVYEDSAVSLVLDLSASMNGEKIEMARAVIMAMADMLDRLRVPFEVIGFNSGGNGGGNIRVRPANIYEIKRFEDSYRRVFQNFGCPPTSGTNEWPAIKRAAYHLAERRETKKVMFILTDGCTEYGTDKVESDTRYTIKMFINRLKKAGMKVVGLGILDDSAEYYCPDFVSVRNLNAFAGEMYGKIAKYLL